MTTTAFLTDSTICIGCKACEVACKEWNQVPDDGFAWSGLSYDNTAALGHSTWRHVKFVERDPIWGLGGNAGSHVTWAFSSDVCKHCENAGCLEACPTGSIVRTEFGGVYVQPDICNGCGYCVVSCPFGVLDQREDDGRVWKCTLCYDRLQGDMEPACAQACPTDSIQFGELDELRERAAQRVEVLHERGRSEARLYGEDPENGVGGFGAFFLLLDEPETYRLPPNPVVPTRFAGSVWKAAGAAAVTMVAGIAAGFLGRKG
jgi:formate dehydrogenase iron-sulfur subunit